MFYLLHCDTSNCVNLSLFIGIASDKNEVMELVFNFHKHIITTRPDDNFENLITSGEILHILKITEEEYNYLSSQIENKLEEIENNYKNIKYEPKCLYSTYIYVSLVNDIPNYTIFDKSFHIKYNKILKNSKEIII